MSAIEIAPYFHPTQIVLIDDDIDFLGNLSLQLDADLAYLLFDSTQKALDYINERQAGRAGSNHFFRPAARTGDTAADASPLEIDTQGLCREMQASERFSQISVALVDYAMPQMDGLAFCRQIRDPHIKKILFTGVATESVAVEAFNQGIIDQYIRKHEHSVYDTLNSAIRQLQHDYIRDVFVAAADVFSLRAPALLRHAGVAELIETLRRSHDTVEYYLADEPAGFWLVAANGALQRLVIQSADEARERAEQCRAADVSSKAGHSVARNEAIPDPLALFPDVEAQGRAREITIQPARPVPGDSELVWAIFEPAAGQSRHAAKPSYNEFLEWLDTVGYSLM